MHSDLFSSWPHSIWWKSSRGLKEQVILKVADQTDELKLNSWCGFKKDFLWLRKVFKSFSTTSMPPVEAFLHQPVTPYCLLAPVPRQPLYCLLKILPHPARCLSVLWAPKNPRKPVFSLAAISSNLGSSISVVCM